MYRVLMPVDSSKSRGRAQAKMVADLPLADEEVEVTLLYAFADAENARNMNVGQVIGASAAQEVLRDRDLSIKTIGQLGDPAEVILEVAEEIDADLLVLGGRKRSPLGSALFGSVTQAVILDADRPVVVTGGEK